MVSGPNLDRTNVRKCAALWLASCLRRAQTNADAVQYLAAHAAVHPSCAFERRLNMLRARSQVIRAYLEVELLQYLETTF